MIICKDTSVNKIHAWLLSLSTFTKSFQSIVVSRVVGLLPVLSDANDFVNAKSHAREARFKRRATAVPN